MKNAISVKSGKKRFTLRPAQKIILGFLGIILFGAFMLSLPISSKSREWTGFLDALFTSFSSVCVTGFSSLPVSTHFSRFGQAVILFLTQIGGLGFMTANTLIMLIMRKKISFKDRLAIQDSLSVDSNKGVVKLVRSILIMTLIAELAGCLMLLPFFCVKYGAVGIWHALFTSVSAFCNAGFDIFSEYGVLSLAAFKSNVPVCLIISLLVIFGGIGFTVVADIYKSRFNPKKLTLHSKIVLIVSGVLLLFGTVFFLAAEYSNSQTIGNDSFFIKLNAAFFQSVNTRSAGFILFNQAGLRPASKFMSCILMFIGASPGSTGGGMKTTTFALIVLIVITVIKGRPDVVAGKRTINNATVFKAITIFFLGLLAALTLTIFMMIAEHNNAALISAKLYSFENIFLESFAALSTSGMSAHLSPFLTAQSKLAVMFIMFFGRIGLINIGFAFFNDSKAGVIKYPEGNLIVG